MRDAGCGMRGSGFAWLSYYRSAQRLEIRLPFSKISRKDCPAIQEKTALKEAIHLRPTPKPQN